MFRTAGSDLSHRRGALGIVAVALCALAAIVAPGARADGAEDCTSDSKTLMLATGALATNGYACGYLDNWEEHSIGGWATQFWSSYPAAAYKYDYICDHQTGDVDLIKATTQGQVTVVNGKTVPVAAGSVTYTASNSATTTRHWAVGVIWNMGNPEDGPLVEPGAPAAPAVPPDPNAANAYTKNCGSGPAGDIPSYVLYQATLALTGSVDGATVPTGAAMPISFQSTVVSQGTLPNGQPVALQQTTDKGTTWANVSFTKADGTLATVGTQTADTTLGGLNALGCVGDAGSTLACSKTQEGLGGAAGVAVSPNNATVYVVSPSDDAIAWFSAADPKQGLVPGGCIADVGSKLACASTQQGLAGVRGVAVSPDGKSVYAVGSGDGAIASFARNPSTGALTGQGCIADKGNSSCGVSQEGLGGVTALAVSPDNKSVYTVGTGDDAIVRFDRDPATGALTGQGCISDAGQSNCKPNQQGLGGSTGVVVSPDGKSVYTVGAGDDAIVRFARDATGALTGQGCISDKGQSNCGPVQEGLGGVTGLAVSADGRSVYAVGTGDDAIVRFDRDPATGALTGQGCISDEGQSNCGVTLQGLGGVTALAVSSDGKSVYTVGAGDDAIARLDRDTSSGALTLNSCQSDSGQTNCGNTVPGLGGVAAVAVAANGRSVYTAAAGDSALVNFGRYTPTAGQATSTSGGGVVNWTPTVAGTYTLRLAYPGLNVTVPGRGYTPAASPTFTVTVTAPATSRRARVAAPWPAAPPVATASQNQSAPPEVPHLPPRLGATQSAGFGALSTVNSQFGVSTSGSAPKGAGTLACPKGSSLLNAEAASTGDKAPAGGVAVRSVSSTGVTLAIPKAARGFGAQAQLLCRRSNARHVARHAGFAYGTVRGDVIRAVLPGRVVFGGLGDDRLLVTGRQASASGGLGDDTITLRAAKSNASGGLGNDTLRSTASHRTLLNGGPGKDRLIGSRGPTLINALDGHGGDIVHCLSKADHVAADAGDRIIGPCTRISLR